MGQAMARRAFSSKEVAQRQRHFEPVVFHVTVYSAGNGEMRFSSCRHVARGSSGGRRPRCSWPGLRIERQPHQIAGVWHVGAGYHASLSRPESSIRHPYDILPIVRRAGLRHSFLFSCCAPDRSILVFYAIQNCLPPTSSLSARRSRSPDFHSAQSRASRIGRSTIYHSRRLPVLSRATCLTTTPVPQSLSWCRFRGVILATSRFRE